MVFSFVGGNTFRTANYLPKGKFCLIGLRLSMKIYTDGGLQTLNFYLSLWDTREGQVFKQNQGKVLTILISL
jgi:hypothetical protein